MNQHTISTSFTVDDHRAILSCENLKDLQFFMKRMGLSGRVTTTLLSKDEQSKKAATELAASIVALNIITQQHRDDAFKCGLYIILATPEEVIVRGVIDARFKREGETEFSFDTRHGEVKLTVRDEPATGGYAHTTCSFSGQERFQFVVHSDSTKRICTGAVLLG